MPSTAIRPGFWHDRLTVTAGQAIFHQWRQLEASGCIENFRIAAGESDGLRTGWFFADSDAYKWLDAAARLWPACQDPRLAELMDGFIALLARAMQPDGYLFTYNQIHFPGTRWHNLQIEHELYCHGHLIEAGVSHHQATGRTDLLDLARRAAERIAEDFAGKNGAFTPGHEEIEIALLRLFELTGKNRWLELARQFIEQRGRAPGFALSLLRQNRSAGQRGAAVKAQRAATLAAHPHLQPPELPPGNLTRVSRLATLRWQVSALSGKYFQQHAPVRQQTVPVGHAVRFAYLETAVARLARLTGDDSLRPALEQAWERMVTRRMYVTGGIGALPGLEGFGRDDELDPESAYAETCAALGSLFWNWEMTRLTGEARYADLFEWQLYNAAAVGMGLDGASYLYHNPLACRGGTTRQAWYAVPCCPSNLARTWASLADYAASTRPGQLSLEQYIASELTGLRVPLASGGDVEVDLEVESGLPWQGSARVRLRRVSGPARFCLQLRRPGWAGETRLTLNGAPLPYSGRAPAQFAPTSSGFDPRQAAYLTLEREWAAGDELEIAFEMPIRLLRAHPRVAGHQGRAAVTRGPLVYCLESVDQPGLDIFNTRLEPASLQPVFDPDLLGGTVRLDGKTTAGAPLTLIPYWLWGNRGPSQMTVWVRQS